MKVFREALDECGFADLGYVGQKFTKCKHLAGGITLWERLDKAVADTECKSLFPRTKFIQNQSLTRAMDEKINY